MERIGILDIGTGNLRSVFNAVHQNGFDPELVVDPERIDALSHLILPGVGNFRSAMLAIRALNMEEALLAYAASGRPLLGVCLGMQLLARTGFEGGATSGLGLIDGEVRFLRESTDLRIPHVGWNDVICRRSHPLFDGVKPDRDFYFVHSYAFVCADPGSVLAVSDYGGPVTCAVGCGNVVGVQFHPEKSQSNGLRLLENFCLWDGAC